MNGRQPVWGILAVGVAVLLAGMFIPSSLQAVLLKKTEVIAGAALIISSIGALVITL